MAGLFGGGDDVSVSIGGDSSGLQSAVRQGQEAMGSLGSTVSGMGGGLNDTALSWNSLGQSILGSLGPVGEFVVVGNQALGMLGAILAPIEQAGQAVLSFGEQLATTAVQGVQVLADAVQNLGEQMFQLNNATEKNVYSWSYTYGQGMSRSAALAQAQNMAAWTGQFSTDIPFTRQDLMGAMSGAAMLGNAQTVEQYMPMIADLAATHVNPMTGQPVTLGEAVQAIRGEKMGISRMLRYQLGINPEDLVKYGLKATVSSTGAVHIEDPNSLLPALQAYSEANGWTKNVNGQDQGAAYNTAHATFWGAESSLQDRIQNWLLRAGGMDMSGQVGKGSFFGQLKNDLNGISDWIDKHQGDLNKVADLIGNVFGGGVKIASDAVEGLANGLHASGLDTLLESLAGQLGQWLNDPNTGKGLQSIATTLGDLAGNIGKGGLESGIKLVQGLLTSLQQSGVGSQIEDALKGLGTWLSDPNNQAMLEKFGELIGQIAGAGLSDAVTAIKQIGAGISEFMRNMTPQEMGDIVSFFKILFLGFQNLGTVIGDLIPLLGDFGRVISDLIHGNFSDLGTAIAQTNTDTKHLITDLATNYADTMASIANQSYNWGADFTENMAQGMYSKQADVQRAANEQAKLIANYLHHSTPEMGPLAGDDQWGAEMVTQFADSMTGALPHLQRAASLVASSAAGALPGHGGPGAAGAGGAHSTSYSTTHSTSYGANHTTIHLYGAQADRILSWIAGAQAAQGQQAHLLSVQPGMSGALAGGVGVLGVYGG